MSENIVTWSDSVVTCAILLFTVYASCDLSGTTKKEQKVFLKTLLFLAAYTLLFKPLDMIFGNFYLYLASLFIAGLLYVRYVIKTNLRENSLLVTVFLFTAICVKSVVLPVVTKLIAPFINPSTLAASALCYGLQDLAQVLVSLFLVLHPLAPSHLPRKYWVVMYCGPIVIGLFIQYHVSASSRIGYTFNPEYEYLILIALVLELIIYYSAHIFTITYREYQDTLLMNQKLSLESEYLRRSDQVIKQIHAEKHELKNHYFYLQALAKNHRYDELEQYLASEISDRLNILEEFHTGNELLDHLITMKVAEARQAGIETVTDLALPAGLPIPEEDLYTVVGNLLNNAIDASKKEEKPYLSIQMFLQKGYLNIKIRNRISTDVLKDNPTLETHKKNAEYHGIGLKLVAKITKKYEGTLQFSSDDGYFTSYCVLKMP